MLSGRLLTPLALPSSRLEKLRRFVSEQGRGQDPGLWALCPDPHEYYSAFSMAMKG